jgi:SAM-dependent methyltransferase
MATTVHSNAPPAHVQVLQILNGAYFAGTIACLAELGVPDLVEHGPKSPHELATQLQIQPDALYRLMRAAASIGVLTEGNDGRFSETPLSAVLRSNAKPSLRGMAILTGREWHGMGWAHLADCVRTGRQAFDLVHGTSIFEFFEKNEQEARIFDSAMTALSTIQGPAVVSAYPFAGINSIVDIAGGTGLLLAMILEAHPKMRGTLYDLPHVIEHAKNGPLQRMLDRCTFASGDMFNAVPQGADAYIMKHIIHDWPDDKCVALLQECRRAVNRGGKLLVIDNVIHLGNEFEPGKFLDLQMLIFPGGKERTEEEFRKLFAAAGWKLARVIPTCVPESVLEAEPV